MLCNVNGRLSCCLQRLANNGAHLDCRTVSLVTAVVSRKGKGSFMNFTPLHTCGISH